MGTENREFPLKKSGSESPNYTKWAELHFILRPGWNHKKPTISHTIQTNRLVQYFHNKSL